MKLSGPITAIMLAMLLAACGNNNQTTTNMTTITNEPLMGLGERIEGENFTGDAWLKTLSAEESFDARVYNVTFAPSVRNSWHSHSVGQILLCTEGVGYYQQKGEPARRLQAGDVVNIPADVIHWHGAAPDSRFTHIGITPKAGENSSQWFAAVTDKEYAEATGVDTVPESRPIAKKNIGSVLALYPTPATVLGTLVNGRVNWMVVSHVGIIGHDRLIVSMNKNHYSTQGVRENRKLTINIIDEAMLPRADYAGMVSGADENKSTLFDYVQGEEGMPVISQSPLTMECIVEDIYQTDTFDSFICKIANTYAREDILDADGRIDYGLLKPVLFEMPTYQYLRTGDVIGKCRTLGKNLQR